MLGWLLALLEWKHLTGVAVMLGWASLPLLRAEPPASESCEPPASTDMTHAGVDEVMTTSRMRFLLCTAAREAAAAA